MDEWVEKEEMRNIADVIEVSINEMITYQGNNINNIYYYWIGDVLTYTKQLAVDKEFHEFYSSIGFVRTFIIII